jgi:hypothetical protein
MSGQADPFVQAAIVESQGAAAKASLKPHFPLRLSRKWLYGLTAWLAAAGVMWLMPSLDLLGRDRAQAARTQQEQQLQQAKAEIKQVTERVQATVSQLVPEAAAELAKLDEAAGNMPAQDLKRQAIRKLEELADRLKMQNAEKLDAFQELREAMKGLRTPAAGLSPELNRALARSKFEDAAAMVKDLQNQLDEKNLSAEQKQALAKQLSDLSKQLQELAEKDKGLQEELRKAGADESLAKLGEEELRKKLQEQGLDQQQIEELMKRAAACRACDSAMRALAKAAGAAGSAGESISAEDLAELAEQLDSLEAMKEDLALRQVSLEEILRGKACLGGECDGEGQGLGEWQEGLALRRGGGTGGPGIGQGPRDTADSGQTALQKTRVEGNTKGGPAVASWYYKGQQVKGESQRQFKEMVAAAKDVAAEAISENEIPKKYEGPVKKYFGELEQAGEGPQ